MARAVEEFSTIAPLELTGLRVAWTSDFGGGVPVEAEIIGALEPTVRLIEAHGALVEPACVDFDGVDEAFRTLRALLFTLTLGTDYDRAPSEFKPSLAENIQAGRRVTGRELVRAEQVRAALFARTLDFFDNYDVLIAPTTQTGPFPAGWEYPHAVAGEHQRDYLDWMRACFLVTMMHAPALSLPGGFTDRGLPVGLQIICRPGADSRVLAIGEAIERLTSFALRRPGVRA